LDTEAEPVQRLWARLLAEMGRLQDAYRVLQESLARLKQQKQQYEIARTLEVLADVTAKLDSREAEARAYAEQAHALLTELRRV
jgi:predicted Zn-dependent protease